jgi:SnoaL-like protein
MDRRNVLSLSAITA